MKFGFTFYFYKYFHISYFFISFITSILYNENLYIITTIGTLFAIETVIFFKLGNFVGDKKPFGVFLILIFSILIENNKDYYFYLYYLAFILYLAAIFDYYKIYQRGIDIKNHFIELPNKYDYIQFNYNSKTFRLFNNKILYIYGEDLKPRLVFYNKKYYDYLIFLSFVENQNLKVDDIGVEDIKLFDIVAY